MYRSRATILAGVISALELYLLETQENYTLDSNTVEFVQNHLSDLWLWGESAFPHMVNIIHLLEAANKPDAARAVLCDLLKGIVTSNAPRPKNSIPLANFYYGLHDILETHYDFHEEAIDFSDFSGSSYILWLVVLMMARRSMRKELEDYWRRITHIHIEEFRLDQIENTFTWRTELGENTGYFPPSTQSWSELAAIATDVEESPDFVNRNKALLRLFLLVCPHRMNSHTLCALDCDQK